MKRSHALAGLSREHHQALVVARTLARAGADDADAAAAAFVDFLAAHELAHFAREEEVLLPAIPDDPKGQSLARRLLEDHAHLRAAKRRLQDAGHPVSSADLHELGSRLRAHVQMEERELFPYLERSLDPAALEELGRRLEPKGEGHEP